jgi:hypothetical protein
MFGDFDRIGKSKDAVFPYKMVLFPGNHSDVVSRIALARGFAVVFSFEETFAGLKNP